MNDLISRQAAIDAVEKAQFKGVAIDAVKNLTSVAPEPKNGNWIHEIQNTIDSLHTYQQFRCSECDFCNVTNTNFCPNCGAEMRGDSDESVDQER